MTTSAEGRDERTKRRLAGMLHAMLLRMRPVLLAAIEASIDDEEEPAWLDAEVGELAARAAAIAELWGCLNEGE